MIIKVESITKTIQLYNNLKDNKQQPNKKKKSKSDFETFLQKEMKKDIDK